MRTLFWGQSAAAASVAMPDSFWSRGSSRMAGTMASADSDSADSMRCSGCGCCGCGYCGLERRCMSGGGVRESACERADRRE
jgi:hypothetical protein